MDIPEIKLFGLSVVGISPRMLLDSIVNGETDGIAKWVYTLNLENSWPLIRKEPCLKKIDLGVPDGWPIKFILNRFKNKKAPKVDNRFNGSDFAKLVLNSDNVLRVLIVGGTNHQSLLDERNVRLGKDSTIAIDIKIELDEKAIEPIVEVALRFRPQVILLALNTEKGIFIANILKARINSGLIMVVGSAIDLLTGHQKRAPLIFQKLNLEWAFRLFHHPKRLGFRYLVKSPLCFVVLFLFALRQRIRF